MTDNPQDLAYTRLFTRYDEALERIAVLSRENMELKKSLDGLSAEVEALKAMQKGTA